MRKGLAIILILAIIIIVLFAFRGYERFAAESNKTGTGGKSGEPEEFIVPEENQTVEGSGSGITQENMLPEDKIIGEDGIAPGTAPQPVNVPVPTPPPIPNQTANITPPTTPTPTPQNQTPPGGPYLPSCSDSVWNGDESDLDCGGSCAPCLSTGMYTACWDNNDCQTGNCNMSSAQLLPATAPNGTIYNAIAQLRVLAGQTWIIPYQGTCS